MHYVNHVRSRDRYMGKFLLNHLLQERKAAEKQQNMEYLYVLREDIKKQHNTVSEATPIFVGIRMPSGEKLQVAFQTSSTAVVSGQILAKHRDHVQQQDTSICNTICIN